MGREAGSYHCVFTSRGDCSATRGGERALPPFNTINVKRGSRPACARSSVEWTLSARQRGRRIPRHLLHVQTECAVRGWGAMDTRASGRISNGSWARRTVAGKAGSGRRHGPSARQSSSRVLYIVALYGRCTRAMTFQNVCQHPSLQRAGAWGRESRGSKGSKGSTYSQPPPGARTCTSSTPMVSRPPPARPWA